MSADFIRVKLLTKEVIPGPLLPLGGVWKEEEGLAETGEALAPRHIEWGYVCACLAHGDVRMIC